MAATQAACTGRPRLKAGGARARAERTSNMWSILVTLNVSKLSGWLNALAPCRVERRESDAEREVRPGRREGIGWRRRKRHARGGGPTQKAVGTRGAHVEHAEHVRDLGRVEAERLVEFLRGLPSRTRRACDAGRGAGWGGVRTWGGSGGSGVHAGMWTDTRLGAIRARAERT